MSKEITEKEPSTKANVATIDYRRDEDFFSGYANNSFIESSGWDLKIIFGQTDQKAGENVVIQHTAIALAWPQAKVLSYFLQLHIAAREAEDGHIAVPSKVVQELPREVPPESEGNAKHPKEALEAMRKIWEKFVAANPEAKL